MAETHNGWTNYETWACNLWLTNGEGSQPYWAARAQEAYDAAEADDTFTRAERATLDLADELKSEHEEDVPDLGASFYSDLLNAGLGEVNWYEIAESLIAAVDKDAEEADAAAPTIAEQIAAALGNSGTAWRTDDGSDFAELVGAHPCHRERATDGERVRYTFADGSVITTADGAWDFGYATCFCWTGAGHMDDCGAQDGAE